VQIQTPLGGANPPEDMFLFVASFLFNLFPPFIAAPVLVLPYSVDMMLHCVDFKH
jgi:hypothetical protein